MKNTKNKIIVEKLIDIIKFANYVENEEEGIKIIANDLKAKDRRKIVLYNENNVSNKIEVGYNIVKNSCVLTYKHIQGNITTIVDKNYILNKINEFKDKFVLSNKELEDELHKINDIVSLHEKMSSAYFYNPPTTARERSIYQEKNSLFTTLKFEGEIYEVKQETSCSCKHVYYNCNYDIRTIKSLAKKMKIKIEEQKVALSLIFNIQSQL